MEFYPNISCHWRIYELCNEIIGVSIISWQSHGGAKARGQRLDLERLRKIFLVGFNEAEFCFSLLSTCFLLW